ncbi:MAG: hypothetical protein JW947_04230 [Sedimentisphaerales bacterium]|nr:hypothetical protein [Sedimentisphaerales bacterium]
MRTDRLYLFTHDCGSNDAKTPKEFYKAIEKLGPLPRYLGIINGKGEETKLIEPAVEEARAVYAHARKIAIQLRESEPDLPPLPPTEIDPFLGLQTVSEWCISATNLANLKPTETDSQQAKFGFRSKAEEPNES